MASSSPIHTYSSKNLGGKESLYGEFLSHKLKLLKATHTVDSNAPYGYRTPPPFLRHSNNCWVPPHQRKSVPTSSAAAAVTFDKRPLRPRSRPGSAYASSHTSHTPARTRKTWVNSLPGNSRPSSRPSSRPATAGAKRVRNQDSSTCRHRPASAQPLSRVARGRSATGRISHRSHTTDDGIMQDGCVTVVDDDGEDSSDPPWGSSRTRSPATRARPSSALDVAGAGRRSGGRPHNTQGKLRPQSATAASPLYNSDDHGSTHHTVCVPTSPQPGTPYNATFTCNTTVCVRSRDNTPDRGESHSIFRDSESDYDRSRREQSPRGHVSDNERIPVRKASENNRTGGESDGVGRGSARHVYRGEGDDISISSANVSQVWKEPESEGDQPRSRRRPKSSQAARPSSCSHAPRRRVHSASRAVGSTCEQRTNDMKRVFDQNRSGRCATGSKKINQGFSRPKSACSNIRHGSNEGTRVDGSDGEDEAELDAIWTAYKERKSQQTGRSRPSSRGSASSFATAAHASGRRQSPPEPPNEWLASRFASYDLQDKEVAACSELSRILSRLPPKRVVDMAEKVLRLSLEVKRLRKEEGLHKKMVSRLFAAKVDMDNREEALEEILADMDI
eukprot:Rmarinus@m.9319